MVSVSGPGTSDRAAAELTALLCRGLSRLAVAAEGRDVLLDNLLEELRHLLRGDLRDRARFAQVVAAIERRIRAIDQVADAEAITLQQALQRLLAPLLASAVSGPLQHQLITLRDQCAAPAPPSLPDLLARIGDAQRELLARRRPPFWGRLFRRDTNAAASTDAPLCLAEELPPLLLQLLQQLPVPAAVREERQQLVRRLKLGLSGDEIVTAVQELSTLVLAALTHDREAFLQFLATLDQQLMAAQASLDLVRREAARRQDADDALQAAVRDRVAALRDATAAADSVEELKGAVSARLDALLASVTEHKQEEQRHRAALEAQLDALSRRLREQEQESAQAGQRLAAQHELLRFDLVTQMPSRQALDERLQQTRGSVEGGTQLTLAICEIDQLAVLRERYGEQAANKVLRIVARTLRVRLRRADFGARYNDAAFVLLFADLDSAAALAQVEAARLAVAECPFYFREQPVAVTLSAGVATAAGAVALRTLLPRAEAGLAQARAAGGNCSMPAATPAPGG
ncbi:MAG: diguanylate cyclase [Spongiibacteraceae bacterium]|jgi:diguanylate cyclase|nr:diguanylate cyclase [Spongiibacteraceae bacterium]